MNNILILIALIIVATSCSTKKDKDSEPVQAGEKLPLTQDIPRESDEDFSNNSENDEDFSNNSENDEDFSNNSENDDRLDAQPVTLIVGDYLDRSISSKNAAAIDLIYLRAIFTNQGPDLFNFLDETYANQENSPYYQYAASKFPNNRIVQSSIASATVGDAESLLEKAIEIIDEGEFVDQIIINLGTLDFCQSTADFALKYQNMLAHFLENESLKSATFTIISPIDLTKLPYFDPNFYEGKDMFVQHQFCSILSHQKADEHFRKIQQVVVAEMFRLSDARTVFFADISKVATTFEQADTSDGFNLRKSGITKIVIALENNMIKPNLEFLSNFGKN